MWEITCTNNNNILLTVIDLSLVNISFPTIFRLGSQFFITLGDNLDFLDKEHCVFGEVVEGHDALLNINEAICDENHVPYQDIRHVFHKFYTFHNQTF